MVSSKRRRTPLEGAGGSFDGPASRDEAALSVSEVTARIKQILEGAEELNSVRVSGEASNVKYHPNGHLYFTLKDEGAQIGAVMFRGDLRSVPFKLEEGARVIATGDVRVYAPQGRYQLYARALEKAGLGDLYRRFEELKKQLAEEGLFAAEHKKTLPSYPQRIGVVTSGSGAAFRDIVNVLARRWPLAEVVLAPAAVQGERAPAEIVAGIKALDRLDLDVMIVGRGGGSIEDLWAFNDEGVARAIFAAETPVVSAVGHEIDFTIADFAADRRAATPTEAAELVSPDVLDVRRHLGDLADTMSGNLDERIAAMKLALAGARRAFLRPLHKIERSLALLRESRLRLNDLLNQRTAVIWNWHARLGRRLRECSPRARAEMMRKRMNEMLHRAEIRLRSRLGGARLELERDGRRLDPLIRRRREGLAAKVKTAGGRLEALSPAAILARGYAVVFDEEGRAVKRFEDVETGQAVTTRLYKGELLCRVEDRRAEAKNQKS